MATANRCAAPLAAQTLAPQRQAFAQRESGKCKAGDHPRRVAVGQPAQDLVVVSGGIQLLDLMDGVVGQALEQGGDGALQVVDIARLEREQNAVVLLADTRVGAQHQ